MKAFPCRPAFLYGPILALAFAAALAGAPAPALADASLPGGLLKAEANVAAARASGQALFFQGQTNLPDGTRMVVAVGTDKGQLIGQMDTSVAAGAFRAGPFAVGTRPLPPGAYRVQISSASGALQPRHVVAALGARGEKLTGPLVQSSRSGRHVLFQSVVQAP